MRGFDGGYEVEFAVAVPHYVHRVVVEIFRQVFRRARRAVIDQQAFLVRFVARTAHRAERYLLSVGRPDRIFVVARHFVRQVAHLARAFAFGGRPRFADVFGRARRHVVHEYVRIRRDGVCGARQRFARVGQFGPGRVPRYLGHVEIGGQRGVPRRLGADDVLAARHQAVAQFGYEDVAVVALIPVVPVADHQIVVDAGFRFGQVVVDVRRFAGCDVHGLHPPDVFAVGADTEALDIGHPFAIARAGQLSGIGSPRGHLPYLHRAAAVGEEIDFRPIGRPTRRQIVRRSVGQSGRGFRDDLFDPKGGHAAILGH